jgi:hypothetical protein
VTAHAYQQPVATDSPQPADAGYRPATCGPGSTPRYASPPTSKGRSPCRGCRGCCSTPAAPSPSHTGYSGFPMPEYPWGDQQVSAGQCVRGWIVFPVNGATRPTQVQYAPGGQRRPDPVGRAGPVAQAPPQGPAAAAGPACRGPQRVYGPGGLPSPAPPPSVLAGWADASGGHLRGGLVRPHKWRALSLPSPPTKADRCAVRRLQVLELSDIRP